MRLVSVEQVISAAHCVLVSELITEHEAPQHFTLTEKRQLQISSNSGHWSPTASGFLPADNPGQQDCQAHLLCYEMGTVPPPQGTDIAVELAKCLVIHRLKYHKEAHTQSERKKHFFTQGTQWSTNCKDSLPMEVWHAQAHSHVAERKSTLLSFPTVSLGFCLLHIVTLALEAEYNPKRGLQERSH